VAEKKNTKFNRPGGYAQPRGAIQIQRQAARSFNGADIRLAGDTQPPFSSANPAMAIAPAFRAGGPDTQLYVGDCREVLANLPEKGQVDLIFADPPFNWEVPYAGSDRAGKGAWNDAMPRAEYERFTFDWLDGCIEALAPHGSLWVNIPDDTAAEVVLHLKRRGLTMINWCIWHFRFGQNRNSSFIMSKVHALYFAKLGNKSPGHALAKSSESVETSIDPAAGHSALCEEPQVNSQQRIWNPNDILELSDRASIYSDPRTMNKESNKGLRVPMDVWYGQYWGRIQGNNKERRHNHHNQIPEIYLERIIKASSNPSGNTSTPAFGSLVLDPFCGSGTTSTVARALGRRSITIEYSKVNARSAWERITKVGMVEREDAGKPQSTAIFKSRRKRTAIAQI
jgi:adenine-specific DNA-methyltransferase